MLIAVAFLSYSGPFNQKYRALLIEKWQANLRKNDIPFTENIDVIGFLSNQNQVMIIFRAGVKPLALFSSAILYPLGEVWIDDLIFENIKPVKKQEFYFYFYN